ncbi:helix-turn-helix domain-containing protein [Sulfitobacter sp.]|uniref:helix-turn-helix domain-containing protein n=1 Tax=Sulfitobacter sp. TaxID=1903071 RepID=UPI003F6B2576
MSVRCPLTWTFGVFLPGKWSSKANGRQIFFTMLGAIATFETAIRKERQREGIDAALAKGEDSPFRGRPASINAEQIAAMQASGVPPSKIAKQLGIARSSVYRYLCHSKG